MITSKYLKNQQDWDERIRVMENNLRDGYLDFLYFNISINMIDAGDNADYDRELILKKMMMAFKKNDFRGIQNQIDRLKRK